MKLAQVINKVGEINLPSQKTVLIVGGVVLFFVLVYFGFLYFRWKMQAEADGPF